MGKPVPFDGFNLFINCYMIKEQDMIDNPNLTGVYNVPRYIANFNKRVEPLLVVFKPDIRDTILIENPDERQYFTKLQTELVNGFPLKESGQDKLDEVMTLSDSEVLFWNRIDRDPYFMYVEDTLELADQHWVEFNRKVVKFQEESNQTVNEDEIIESSGNDFALHAVHV